MGVLHVSYGPSSNPSIYAARDCQVTKPHTEVTCSSVEGWGKSLGFKLSVLQQTSNATEFSYAYSKPSITRIIGAELLDTSGGDVLTIGTILVELEPHPRLLNQVLHQ